MDAKFHCPLPALSTSIPIECYIHKTNPEAFFPSVYHMRLGLDRQEAFAVPIVSVPMMPYNSAAHLLYANTHALIKYLISSLSALMLASSL